MKCQVRTVKGYGKYSRKKKIVTLGIFHAELDDDFIQERGWTVTDIIECDGKLEVRISVYHRDCWADLDIEYKCNKCHRLQAPDNVPYDVADLEKLVQAIIDLKDKYE